MKLIKQLIFKMNAPIKETIIPHGITLLKLAITILIIGYFSWIFSHFEQRLSAMETLLKNSLEQVQGLLKEQGQEMTLLKEHDHEFGHRTGEILATLHQIQETQTALNEFIHQECLPLFAKLSTLSQPLSSEKDDHTPINSQNVPAEGYRIFGVQPYGVIITTPTGRFAVARVGQSLDQLGIVKTISAHRVIVGNFFITD